MVGKAARQLSERARRMYELRKAGYEWKEITGKFSTTDAAARAEYSRELSGGNNCSPARDNDLARIEVLSRTHLL